MVIGICDPYEFQLGSKLKYLNNKNLVKLNFLVGCSQKWCGDSDHKNLTLALFYLEKIDGINCFFACFEKFMKSKSYLLIFDLLWSRIGKNQLMI